MLARLFAEVVRLGVRFFRLVAFARLAAVVVRRVAAFRLPAVRPFREAVAPRFERDFVLLDFLRVRAFVRCLVAMDSPPVMD